MCIADNNNYGHLESAKVLNKGYWTLFFQILWDSW